MVATAIRTNTLSLAHRVIGGLIVDPFEHANQLVRADDYVATIAITPQSYTSSLMIPTGKGTIWTKH